MDSPGRLRRALRLVRRHRFKTIGLVGFAAACGLNVLAYQHADAMTSFAGATGPGRIEALSTGQKARALFLGVSVPRPANQGTPPVPYRTVAFSASDGTALEAWHLPADASRGTVVLFHGYAASRSAFLAHALELHDLGYSTLLVDFRGHGGSSGSETTLGYHEAKDVAAAARLARELEPSKPLVLFGSSMGAAAVLRAVHAEGVRPEGVVLEAPFDRLSTTVRNRFEIMGAPSFPAAELLLFWGGVQRDIDGWSHDPVDYARSVRCPTLLLHGERDERVSVPQARAVFDALGAADKTFALFEGVGHESYLDLRPDAWRAALRGFLARVTVPHESSSQALDGD